MRTSHRIIASLLAAALLCVATPGRSNAQSLTDDLSSLVSFLLNSATSAPPQLPQYYQPPAQQQNQIWQPGYWANGQGGYFWVPGTWVTPPQQNTLWTPGYWASNNGSYQWNQGYWAQNVGYYGDVNYGNGYYGTGYTGGQWRNNNFYYNTAVSNVQPTITRYVYIDRTVLVNKYRGNRISYNGGHGIIGKPTQRELLVKNERHYHWTNVQQQHVLVAAQNRNFLAHVNHGVPSVVAVPKPFTRSYRPQGFAPVERPQQAVVHHQSTQREQQPVRREQPMQQHEQPIAHQPIAHQPLQHEHQPQRPDQKANPHGKPDAKPTQHPEFMN